MFRRERVPSLRAIVFIFLIVVTNFFFLAHVSHPGQIKVRESLGNPHKAPRMLTGYQVILYDALCRLHLYSNNH